MSVASIKKKINRIDIRFIVICLLVICLQLWKCRLSMGFADEHFYVTLGYRLLQGDALFYDDWHIAQMIGVFIYPLLLIRSLFIADNTGVILDFRHYYIVYNLIIAICIYLRFREKKWAAIGAAVAFMLFSPYNFFALSYNSMGPGFLVLAALIYPYGENGRLRLYFSGLFYAWAVLNNPYLALVFVCLTILTIVKKDWFPREHWLWMFFGILSAAIIFIGFVFSRASVSQVFSCLKYLIDPSHSTGIFMQFLHSGGNLLVAFKPFLLIMFAMTVYSVVIRKKERDYKINYLKWEIAVNLLAIVYICWIRPYQMEFGGYMLALFPFAFIGCDIILMFETDPYLDLCFWLSAFNGLVISVSSNVGPRAFSAPLIFACCITILLLYEIQLEWQFSATASVFFLFVLLFFKVTNIYWGSGNYSVKVERGPLAGLWDAPESIQYYYEVLDDIEYINTLEGEYVNLVTFESWEYLALEKRMATNSTYEYLWKDYEYIDVISDYRDIHPERYPAYVYIDLKGNRYQFKPDSPWVQQFEHLKDLKKGVLYLQR